MKVRLLTNLKVDETTTLPLGKVVDIDPELAAELIGLEAAVPELDPAPAAAPAIPPAGTASTPGTVAPAPAPDPSTPAAAATTGDPTAAAAAPGVTSDPAAANPATTPVDDLKKADLVTFAKETLNVELNPADTRDVLLAQVKQLQAALAAPQA